MKLYYQFVVSLIIFIAVCLGALGYFLNTEYVREFAKISRLKGELPQEIAYQMLVDAVMAPIPEGYDGGILYRCQIPFDGKLTYKEYKGYPPINSPEFEEIRVKKSDLITEKEEKYKIERAIKTPVDQPRVDMEIVSEVHKDPITFAWYLHKSAKGGLVWMKLTIYRILATKDGSINLTYPDTYNTDIIAMREYFSDIAICEFIISTPKSDDDYLKDIASRKQYNLHMSDFYWYHFYYKKENFIIPQWLHNTLCEAKYRGINSDRIPISCNDNGTGQF